MLKAVLGMEGIGEVDPQPESGAPAFWAAGERLPDLHPHGGADRSRQRGSSESRVFFLAVSENKF